MFTMLLLLITLAFYCNKKNMIYKDKMMIAYSTKIMSKKSYLMHLNELKTVEYSEMIFIKFSNG